jgi:hypothetical protein
MKVKDRFVRSQSLRVLERIGLSIHGITWHITLKLEDQNSCLQGTRVCGVQILGV